MTLLNYVHYTVLAIIALLFVVGIISALKQSDKKMMFGMFLQQKLVDN